VRLLVVDRPGETLSLAEFVKESNGIEMEQSSKQLKADPAAMKAARDRMKEIDNGVAEDRSDEYDLLKKYLGECGGSNQGKLKDPANSIRSKIGMAIHRFERDIGKNKALKPFADHLKQHLRAGLTFMYAQPKNEGFSK
jgi:hypothetical protein